jgi:hypothetical protein
MTRMSERVRRLENVRSEVMRYLISDEPMADDPGEMESALDALALRCGRNGYAPAAEGLSLAEWEARYCHGRA